MKDLIDRQAAIDALAEDMPSAYTPDGSHPTGMRRKGNDTL